MYDPCPPRPSVCSVCGRSAHRWGGAFPANPLGEPFVGDEQRRIVACGDFCLQPKVEGAVLSGLAAAQKMRSML